MHGQDECRFSDQIYKAVEGRGDAQRGNSLAGREVFHNLGASAGGGDAEWGGEIVGNYVTGKAGLRRTVTNRRS